MATKVVPLIAGQNQSMTCTLPVDGQNLTLTFNFVWNGIGNYWYMAITNTTLRTLLLDAIPLVPGSYPAGNILGQYSYLKIGSAWVVPASSSVLVNNPGLNDFGSNYYLVWSDTV